MASLSKAFRDVLRSVIRDYRIIDGLKNGEPRPGHPEGTIEAHVKELEVNLKLIKDLLEDEEYWKIKILIMVHDAFKSSTSKRVPIEDPNSHASKAAVFLIDIFFEQGWSRIGSRDATPKKTDLLYMCQYHDVPYAIWRKYEKNRKIDEERFSKLLDKINDWDTFLAFNLVDNLTVGKDPKPTRWFLGEMKKRVKTKVDGSWIKRILKA